MVRAGYRPSPCPVRASTGRPRCRTPSRAFSERHLTPVLFVDRPVAAARARRRTGGRGGWFRRSAQQRLCGSCVPVRSGAHPAAARSPRRPETLPRSRSARRTGKRSPRGGRGPVPGFGEAPGEGRAGLGRCRTGTAKRPAPRPACLAGRKRPRGGRASRVRSSENPESTSCTRESRSAHRRRLPPGRAVQRPPRVREASPGPR